MSSAQQSEPVSGRHIFDSNGMCFSCRSTETQHRMYLCGRLKRPERRVFGRQEICVGECMYRVHPNGDCILCSVCPHCLKPPANRGRSFKAARRNRTNGSSSSKSKK